MGRVIQKQNIKSSQQFNSFSAVIEFSLGHQGLNSLLQTETALFPLFIDDMMDTGCGRAKLYS